MTLPRIFNLPGGRYESFGFLYEPGKDLPIGVSKRRYQGIDRVSFNCAICHYGSVRDTPDSKPLLIAGMPSNTVDLRAFYKFLFDAAKDQRFSAALVLSEDKAMGIHEDFIALVKQSRGARLTGPENDLFSGEYWAGRKAIELGLADGIGDLRSVLRQRYGDKVQIPLVAAERSLFGRARPGIGLETLDLATGRLDLGRLDLAGDIVSALETRALWARYGL